ncbi:alpha-galactosidase [Auriculariales sp. MPI-PUGE-AT-0066]|nr:alpha-galactosidase [Auriculariales sp. MPI-PUGE-AT-0066]
MLTQLVLLQSVSLATAIVLAHSDTNNLSKTPALGWNSWNYFGCDITQDTFLDAARVLVDSGLNKFGYEYVMIDDCWHADSRDPDTGAPRAHPDKFSKGIKYIADEVHKLGLKLGIYSSAGTLTCARKFGSLGYEEIDAKTYAEWDVDYLKYDNCYNEGQAGSPETSFKRYEKMSKALRATDRPIVYALCNWGEDGPWNWAPSFDSINDYCPCDTMIDCKLPGYHCSVAKIIEFAAPLGQKAGPGHWNDLDMLEVGNGDQTYDEYATHFSLWALVKSPLILGHDLTVMTDETLEIITNKAIIAINQDEMGRPARRGSLQLWAGPLASGDTVLALVNLSPENLTASLTLADAFDTRSAKAGTYEYYDLWQTSDDSERSWGQLQGIWQASQRGMWRFGPIKRRFTF